MKSKIISKNLIIILVLIVLVVFASYYFVFGDIKNRNEHASSLDNELLSENKKSEYVSGLEKTFQSADSDIARVGNSIVSSDGDIKFIESLENMARERGLTMEIDSLTVSDIPGSEGSGIVMFKIKAKTRGPWSGTYKFLAQIESLPVKVLVKNFGLSNLGSDSSETGESSNTMWQSIFEINVLKYK